ncbi:MAG: MMPL family transporter, partial [Desulfosarcina sp.]
MSLGKTVGTFAVEHTRMIAVVIVGVTLVLTILAALPTIWPHRFAPLNPLQIDTDPENMLPEDEPVRVFHDRMKKIMSLNDMIVVGIVNETNEAYGVFTPGALESVYVLTEFIRGLQWRDPENPVEYQGVVEADMIAPSMVDNVESGGAGVVRFEWLMRQPPQSQEEALAVRRKALDLPFFRGTLVSEDGKAIALYLPISSKDVSYRISNTIKQKLDNPSRFFPSEIGNLDDLLRQLTAAVRSENDPLIQRLWRELSEETQQRLLQAEKQIDPWNEAISRLERQSERGAASDELIAQARRLLMQRQSALDAFVADLNTWMGEATAGQWLQADQAMRKRLGTEALDMLESSPADLEPDAVFRLKRLWVEAAFPDIIFKSRLADMRKDATYHITGLPVAEDTFGVQMFKQMAISAPIAMVIIFLLMWFFFRSAIVILPAMFDALIATAATMSLLVITGNTVHIMSSMIPIFIVPIAVLDDVHVISEFFDRYQQIGDRKKTIVELMGGLFTPMLYTTLTTAVGFASLALAPIPPVQVFGLFVAFGVVVAWLCSILLVPAFISALPEKRLKNFGAGHVSGEPEQLTFLGRVLRATGRGTYRYAKPIIIASIVVMALSVYGISRIRVNDNPIKWFERGHAIRVADRVLNDHFGGTYMAYLAFRSADAPALPESESARQKTASPDQAPEADGPEPALPGGMSGNLDERTDGGPQLPAGWGEAPTKAEQNKAPGTDRAREQKPQIFKDPTTLRWLSALESYINGHLGHLVGKSNSVTDIVKTVHRELMVGVERNGQVVTKEEAMRIPETRGGVAQSLLQFQNGHRPQDLWHFVTPDYRTAVIWLQLTSGDNRDMRAVAQRIDDWLTFWDVDDARAAEMVREQPEKYRPVLRSVVGYVTESGEQRRQMEAVIAESPADAVPALKGKMARFSPADPLKHDWFGLTYINVVWQEKMVVGMLKALLGSFLAVFLMMTLLYRSALWGALCMAPLTITITMTYGLIGLIGKDYDMPVAVLTALSLGLAVDYAIHFLTRSRMMYP